ncbi:hypothetical protein JI58_04270 [Marinosulfonomonas sp. PRT-SC04]|nr:hypothetical protein JI58_05220 [Marinosulfonomonas sp. PRT-SC04]KPU84360.1 hypothetical protein JI58_04270 [Marinosulfonomonas sp. PRT-SC04]
MPDANQDTACLNGRLGAPVVRVAQPEASFPRTGRLQAPALGVEVSFLRASSQQWEKGHVRSRQFGTGIIEIVDENAKPLRLTPDQYKTIEA